MSTQVRREEVPAHRGSVPCGRTLLYVGATDHAFNEGPTKKSAPVGAPTPMTGASPTSEGLDRLMTSVERTSDTPPPTCPTCGERGRGAMRDMSPYQRVGHFQCPDGHIYIVSTYVDGVL